MDVIKLVERAYEINKANGWHEEKRDWEELCLLMVSELVEALEDYRNRKPPTEYWYENPAGFAWSRQEETSQKPCGIPSELADVLIRIADAAGLYGEAESLERFIGWIKDEGIYVRYDVHHDLSFAVNLNRIVREISLASADVKDFRTLAKAFYMTEKLALICGIDIERAIDEKLAYNATRGYKHGGKAI